MNWRQYIKKSRGLVFHESSKVYKKLNHNEIWNNIQSTCFVPAEANNQYSFSSFKSFFYRRSVYLPAAAFSFLAVFFLLFNTQPRPYMIPEYIKGTPHLQVNNQRKEIKLGEKIYYPAKIITGMYDQVGFSFFSDGGQSEKKQIAVQSNSKILITRTISAKNTTNTTIFIEKGSSLAHISKLHSHEKFYIENPISKVEAKGTSYLVHYEPISSKSGIILKEGKIKISEKSNGDKSFDRKNEMILSEPSMVQIEHLPGKSIWTKNSNIPDPYTRELKKISQRFSPSLLDYSSKDVRGLRSKKIKNSILFGVFSDDLKFSPVYYRKLIAAVSNTNIIRVLFLDSKKQSLLWEKKLQNEILLKPVLTENHLIYISSDGFLNALSIANGNLKYRVKIGNPESTTGLTKTYHPVWENMILVETRRKLALYIASTGRQAWVKSKMPNERIKLISKDQILLYDMQGNLSSLYTYNGDTLWAKNISTNLKGSYIVNDPWMADRFYIVTINGMLYSFKIENGKRLFTFDIKSKPITNPYITPGTIQIFTKDASLKVLNKNGASLWEKSYTKRSGNIRISYIGSKVFVVSKTTVHQYSINDGSLVDSWEFPGAKEIFLSPGMDYIIVAKDDGEILTQLM